MIKNIDTFAKNIILVFFGTFLVSFFNLLYQLLIAHRLTPVDFAAFNSLLSILVLISTPVATLQTMVIKYTSEFKAHAQTEKIQLLLSGLLKKTSLFALFTLIIFYFISFHIISQLKIISVASGYILTISLALSWITPVLLGGLQGLELFGWFTSISIISGLVKIVSAFLFILFGLKIAGALGAFLASNIIILVISYFPLKNFISLRKPLPKDFISKESFLYLFPVAISNFCFMALVNLDMVLVKYFFIPQEAGFYSLAQMVGKILLFLPGAISIVMFPRISELTAKKMDTALTLKRSLLFASILCTIAILSYNLFPAFIFRILTGKVFSESIILGRLFSISMSLFALMYILILYFLSKKDMRFIKYLSLSMLLQSLAIILFHQSLIQIQVIICINATLLFLIHLFLATKNKPIKL